MNSNFYDMSSNTFYDTPPPTMNGSPHLGHVYSYTLCKIIGDYCFYNTRFGADTVAAFACGTKMDDIARYTEHWEEFLGQKFAYNTASAPRICEFREELLKRGEIKKEINIPTQHHLCNYGSERISKALQEAKRPWDLHIRRDNGLYSPWLNSSLTWMLDRNAHRIVRFQGDDTLGTWAHWSLLAFEEFKRQSQRFEIFVHESVKTRGTGEKISKSHGGRRYVGANVINDPAHRHVVLSAPKGSIRPSEEMLSLGRSIATKIFHVEKRLTACRITLSMWTEPEEEEDIFKMYSKSCDALYQVSDLLRKHKIQSKYDLITNSKLAQEIFALAGYIPNLKRLLNSYI